MAGTRKFLGRTGVLSAFAVIVCGCASELAFAVDAEPSGPRLVEGVIDGRKVQGLQIIGAANRQIILGTDGWIHDFDPRIVSAELETREGNFQPLTAVQLRAQVASEFGGNFEVVSTTHFLVVQPRGTRHRWADIFEQLHRTFSAYFSVRGLRVRTGNFPMVAVVMPDQDSMQTYLRGMGLHAQGLLGVYDRASNRIVMYDHGDQSGGVAATICHEAAHQSAFNTGIHSRFADTPHWIVEGIGCLFQSPAMIEGRRGGSKAERIDPGLMAAYQASYAHHPDRLASDIKLLIGNDRMFKDRSTMENAYAAAWAMTFYLSERESARFVELLKCYGAKAPLESYSEEDRNNDFLRICGVDPQTMARRIAKFLDQP